MQITIVAIRPLGDTSPRVRRPQYGVTIARPDYQKEYAFECCRELTEDDPPRTLFHVTSATLESGFYEAFCFLSKTAKVANDLVANMDGARPVALPVDIDEDPDNVFQFRDPSANRD